MASTLCKKHFRDGLCPNKGVPFKTLKFLMHYSQTICIISNLTHELGIYFQGRLLCALATLCGQRNSVFYSRVQSCKVLCTLTASTEALCGQVKPHQQPNSTPGVSRHYSIGISGVVLLHSSSEFHRKSAVSVGQEKERS